MAMSLVTNDDTSLSLISSWISSTLYFAIVVSSIRSTNGDPAIHAHWLRVFPSRLLAHHGQSSSDKFASVSSAVSRRDTSTARQFRGFSCRTTLAGRAHLHDIQYLFHCPTLHSMGGFVLPHGRPLLRSFAWAVSPVTVTAPWANLAL